MQDAERFRLDRRSWDEKISSKPTSKTRLLNKLISSNNATNLDKKKGDDGDIYGDDDNIMADVASRESKRRSTQAREELPSSFGGDLFALG